MVSIKIKKWIGDNQVNFINMLDSGNLTFFDYKNPGLPIDLVTKKSGIMSSFAFQSEGNPTPFTSSHQCIPYEKNEEIARLSGNATFLSGRSLRALLTKYPYRSKYVLCRTNFDMNWVLALPGLIRRIRLGNKRNNAQIIYKGTIETCLSGRTESWIVIENRNARIPTHFSLDQSLGAAGLLKYLNSNSINYVILRFFENLPEKYREGGDIDMLVSDEDLPKVIEFLESNPGGEMVDMYGVSTPASTSMLPYHPPYLSRKLLQNKRIGPGHAYVPSDIDYLNSFIYHCLYHKGLSSGIPTTFKNLTPSSSPDNNYSGKIVELARKNGLKLNITLEDLDAYMAECGWRPHIDTLEFIASNNEWVASLLNSLIQKDEIGLNVCIIKKGAISDNIFEEIILEFKKHDLKIIKSEILSETQAKTAFNYLRGGNWTSKGNDAFHPGAAIVLADNRDFVLYARKKGIHVNRIREIKTSLRRKLDKQKESYIHITDNTTQAIEYLNVLYPDQKQEILQEISDMTTTESADTVDIKSYFQLQKIRALSYHMGFTKKIKSIISQKLG